MGFFSRKKEGEVAPDTGMTEDGSNSEKSPGIGPWDESDHPDRGDLLDAGALWLPTIAGATIQFSVDQRRKIVLGAVYIKDNSALQLQVFAAPKSTGLWEEVRAELISAIASQGGRARQMDGDYGVEVKATMPVADSTMTNPVRYVGVDGPRWLLRATVTGKGAVDVAAGNAILHDVLDLLVVSRGRLRILHATCWPWRCLPRKRKPRWRARSSCPCPPADRRFRKSSEWASSPHQSARSRHGHHLSGGGRTVRVQRDAAGGRGFLAAGVLGSPRSALHRDRDATPRQRGARHEARRADSLQSGIHGAR